MEFCEDNDITPGDEDSDEFYEWCREEADNNFEADMENIKACKEYNVPVVVTGRLGLWDGSHEIMPVVFPSVYAAIQQMLDRSIHDIEVKYDDGEIYVKAYHHDGCNWYFINALSAKGQKKAGYNFNNTCIEAKEHDVKRLPYLYAIGI